MNTIKHRLRNLIVYILTICILICNSQMLSLIVEAAVPDNYYEDLVVGDILLPDKLYKFAMIDHKNFYSDCDFIFEGMGTLGDIESILPNDTTAINEFNNISIGGEFIGERFVVSKTVDGIVYYYTTVDDYTFENSSNYNEPFLELKLVGDNTDTSTYELLHVDENFYEYWGYAFPANYNTSSLPSGVRETIHIHKDLIQLAYYGIKYFCVTPPSDANLLGWKVNEIKVDYPYAGNNDYEYSKCLVTLIPIYANDYVRVNYYTKPISTGDNYTLSDSELLQKSNIVFKGADDLVDACFVEWDKKESDITTSTSEIDLYAQYGLFTKITKHPKDVNAITTDTVSFDVTAKGENLSYTWIAGDSMESKTTTLSTFSTMDNFICSNGIFKSTNTSSPSSSEASVKFMLSQAGTLYYDYFLSCSPYSDSALISIRKLNTDNNTWSIVHADTIYGGATDYDTKSVQLEPGRYKLEFNYNRDYYSYPEGDECLYFKNVKLEQQVLSGVPLSMSGESISFNKDDANFVNGKLFQCIVSGKYGTAYSDIAQLNITPGGRELLNISAVYTGDPIKVNTNYNVEDVKVTASFMDYGLASTITEPISPNDFSVNSRLVTQIGNNTFTAIYDNCNADFVVPGGDIPGVIDLNITDVTTSSANVEWLKPADNGYAIQNYNFYLGDNTSPISVTDLNYALANLDEGTEYEVGVSAVNYFGEGPISKDKFTTLSGIKAVSLDAKYNGKPILVNKTYSKEDVLVTVHYNNSTSKVLSSSDWTESGLLVKVVGDNKFTASYEDLSTEYTVPGFSEPVVPISLTAEYAGPDIRTGNKYNKDDVSVKVNYSDGSSKLLNSSEWTESGISVTEVGPNKFKANYNNLEATYSVNGIAEVVGIKATYNGKDIPVGKSYVKKDVSVVVLYHDGTSAELPNSKWKENSLKVTKEGKNKFTATYEDFSDNYFVKGYIVKPKPEPEPEPEVEEPTPTVSAPSPVSYNGTPVHTGVSMNFKMIIILALLALYSFIMILSTTSKDKESVDDE